MYLNKAIIIGNLTRDPELRALPSGIPVTSFGVATNRVYKDKDGNKKEDSEFHNIQIFGKLAETCNMYLKKGQSVLVEGRIQTRSWDKDGTKIYRTEIIAETCQFGPKTGNDSSITPEQIKKVNDMKEKHNEEVAKIGEDDIDAGQIPF